MIRRPPRSTRVRSSAASDVYKRQTELNPITFFSYGNKTYSCRFVVDNPYCTLICNNSRNRLGRCGKRYAHHVETNRTHGSHCLEFFQSNRADLKSFSHTCVLANRYKGPTKSPYPR